MFVRPTDDGIELSDRAQICHRVGDNEPLAILADRGIVIRPRALVTTMFARLILGDMFFHGIGGAKYDQLTDEIIRRFFGCRPPSFLTVTATAQLPLELPTVTEQDVTQIDRLLRELQFHAECHVDVKSSQKVERLVERKRHWISTLPPQGSRQQRHREIVRANNGLQQFVASKRGKLLQKRRKLADNLRIRRILASREFSFCLFSEETLRPLLLELSHP